MKYASLVLLLTIGVLVLIMFFQNLLQQAANFSILFFTMKTTASIPLIVGFVAGAVFMLVLFLFYSPRHNDWEE